MIQVYSGCPDNITERLEKEQRVYALLDKLKIGYTRIDHEPLMTMEACLEADEALDVHVCKNLLLRNAQKTAFYLLMMPGDKKFKTKELSKQINSARLSFAEAEFMERFLDITPGSLSVLGLMNDTGHDVRLLIDEDVLAGEYVGMHPCINTSTLKMKTEDLINKVLPEVGHEYLTVRLTGED